MTEGQNTSKILIIGCKRAMDDVCIGCSRCLVAFNRRDGEFTRYADQPGAQVLGLLNCGDCPGATIVTRLAQLSLWNSKLGEKPTAVHVGPCIIDHCPYAQTIVGKIKAKAGIPVYEGTHTYKPDNIFA